ncbi:MAG: hypothetical protein IIU71_05400 [Selenomonadaceae bacterium]|nr:hypothetical protein [Selenomonadaceae bacterium]
MMADNAFDDRKWQGKATLSFFVGKIVNVHVNVLKLISYEEFWEDDINGSAGDCESRRSRFKADCGSD